MDLGPISVEDVLVVVGDASPSTPASFVVRFWGIYAPLFKSDEASFFPFVLLESAV